MNVRATSIPSNARGGRGMEKSFGNAANLLCLYDLIFENVENKREKQQPPFSSPDRPTPKNPKNTAALFPILPTLFRFDAICVSLQINGLLDE